MTAAPAVLLTRPRVQSEALAASLAAEGWRALIWPLLEIAPTGAAPDYAAHQATLLTSANAARAAAPGAGRALCVGAATAEAARAAGFDPVESAEGDAAALAGRAAARLDPAAGPLLFLRGGTVAADLAGALRARGFAVSEAVVYAAREGGAPEAEARAALTGGALRAVMVYSPRTAEIFAARAPALGARLDRATALAISAAAAAPLRGLGFEAVRIAERPDGAAMRAALSGLRRAR